MAILKDSDVFDFDRYRQQLAETGAAALSLAQSTEAGAARMRSAYDSTISGLRTLQQQINATSTAQVEKAGQSFKAYEEQIDKLAQDAERYRLMLKTLDDAQAANGLSIQDMTRLLGLLEKEYKSLKPEQADFAARQQEIAGKVRAVSVVLNAQNQVLKEAKKATDAAEGSYNKLKQETDDLRNALRQMPNAFDQATGAINRHNHAALEMQSIIERNDKVLRTADATMLKHNRTLADSGGSFRSLGNEALQAAGGILGISSAFEAISSGLKIISDMERIDASLQAVSKDTADFRHTQEFLIATADRLGLQYEILAKSYKGLKAATNQTSLEGKATEQIFTGLVNAGAALKLSNEEVEGALLAVTQMVSKQKVSMEELSQQLGERLPGALRILAEGMGISTGKMTKMVESGQLLATDVLPKLAGQLDKVYGANAQNNVESMSGGWNRLTNQVHLFLAAMNDNGAISATANNFSNMIADVLKGLRVAVQSDDWKTFFGAIAYQATRFSPLPTFGKEANQQMQNYARNQTVVDQFRTMDAKQRDARLGITQDNISRNENRLKTEFQDTVFGGKKSDVENTLKADRDLLRLLRREDLKLRVKDRTDADQAEINAVRAANEKKEAQADKAEKDRQKKEAAARKAQSEADRKLNASLGVSKAETDTKLAGLTNDRQDGLISEKTFIDERQKVTLAGIAERQSLLEKAGKKESDDYKTLLKEKLDAETLYKRDSLKLALSDSKSATAGSLAGLASNKAEGSISDAEYVEKKLAVSVGGLRDQQRILAEAGQAESKLYSDLENQILDATREYYRDRLKVAQEGWKKELDETKNALSAVDSTLGEEYSAQLLELQKFYDEKERAVKTDVASRKITADEGEVKLHELKLERLRKELEVTEQTYAKDRTLSDALIDDKIAALDRYKADSLRTPKEIAEAEAQILKLKLLKEKEAADDKKRLDREVAENSKQQSDETTEHVVKNTEKATAKNRELWQGALQLAGTIGDSLASISDAYAQRDLNNLDAQRENELKLAGDNADAKALIEEQYQKRKAEIARKAAIAEREAALFSIAINTAQAVMSVLATGGGAHYLDFGVSAGVLSAFVTAAGLAQAAAVLAKPLPAFWTGTSNAPEGFALVGDRGPEIRQHRDGSLQYYDRPTVDYLNAGDRIYTASQTARMVEQFQRDEMARQALQESLLYGKQADRLRDGKQAEQLIIQQHALASGPNFTKRDIKEAFSEALDARPQEITSIDIDGMKRGLKNANGYVEYMEKRKGW